MPPEVLMRLSCFDRAPWIKTWLRVRLSLLPRIARKLPLLLIMIAGRSPRLWGALAVITAIAILIEPCSAQNGLAEPVARSRWQLRESENFRIHSFGIRPIDEQTAAECESIRLQVVETWLGKDGNQAWKPKCDLVLHSTAASYLAATGQPGDRSVASALIRAERGKVNQRRIDVRAYNPRWLEHLPHELTHIMVNGWSSNPQLPRWIDEGMALTADSPGKRAGHLRDLTSALRTGSVLRMNALMTLEEYPADCSINAFYGQSLSVVELLVARGGHEKFTNFARMAPQTGYDDALRKTYGIRDIAELEFLWLADLRRTSNPIASSSDDSNRAKPASAQAGSIQ